jgi:spore maturation protein CgeB
MKVLLFFPTRYGLTSGLANTITSQGANVDISDYQMILHKYDNLIERHAFRLNERLKRKMNHYFLNKINNWYREKIKESKPDIIFVYNHSMLIPDLARWIKENGIKLGFFLGDSPFYTHTNDHYLELLDYADAVFSPDTFWESQLKKMGLNNVHFMPVIISDEEYFNLGEIAGRIDYELDAVYVGTNYSNSWGYKKAKFMNHFAGNNLKILGDKGWKKWLNVFPDLKNHFVEKHGYIPVSEVNGLYNKTKLVPVDGNPGIMHGIHSRVIEALSAGTLPFMEYNPDMDIVFEGIQDLPYVKSYDEIHEKLNYFLNNDRFRQEKIIEMQSVLKKKYNKEYMGKFILNAFIK